VGDTHGNESAKRYSKTTPAGAPTGLFLAPPMHRAYLQWLSFTTVLALLLPSLVLATSYQLMRVGHFDAQLGVTSGLKMLAGIAVAACAIFLLGRFRENLADSLQRQGIWTSFRKNTSPQRSSPPRV
jgi:hypothetical protein